MLTTAISQPMSEISDLKDSISRVSTPDMPPAKRVKETNGDTQPTAVEEAERFKRTMQAMEDEFQEVLKAEQEKYELGIKALKVKHRQELNQQRERYESRISDLIKIMRNF
ncbi:hypothetical protein F4805DRAFT_185598 [Annulohypoxylon moriforme]|nr:hypothetical protein F4805DRAFT_185598 [Annulohypoxylon moriforme]